MPCDLNPGQCRNGATCTNDNQDGYTCSCPNGYTGENCEISKDKLFIYLFIYSKILKAKLMITLHIIALPCQLDSSQCQNGGTCKDDFLGSYHCQCSNGYTGSTCSICKGWKFFIQNFLSLVLFH